MKEERKKSKIKLLIQMIIILALVLGISTMVWAASGNDTYPIGSSSSDLKKIENAVIGDRVQFQNYLWDQYENHSQDPDVDTVQINTPLYCVERGQKLYNGEIRTYDVISKATITGNSATEAETDAYKYITVEKENITRETQGGKVEHRVIPDFPDGADYANARFAYILHQYDEKFEGKKEEDKVQNAVWNYMPTWINYVGKYFEGIVGTSFSNGVKGDTDAYEYEKIKQAGIDYAKKIKLEDKTKHTKIQPIHQANVKNFDEGEGVTTNSYVIGPFKWITGNTDDGDINPNAKMTLTDSNGNIIYSEGFDIAIKEKGSMDGIDYDYKKVNTKYGIPSNKDFYIVIPHQEDTVLLDGNLTITYNSEKDVKDATEVPVTNVINNDGIGIKVEMKVKNGIVAEIWFLKAREGTRQNLIYTNTKLDEILVKEESKYNVKQIERNFVDLRIIKIDDSEAKTRLPKVEMVLKNNDMGDNFYVNVSKEGEITYVERDKATEFYTNSDGVIEIKGLEEGNYTIVELKNPNYGYVLDGDGTYNVNIKKGETEVVEVEITNIKVYTKISGYVWLDGVEGKESTRNNIYDNNENDRLMQDITVRLVDEKGNRIQETKTDENGAYTFIDIEISKLDNYYVEFYYDGVKYTNVTPNLELSNGSKAEENDEDRKIFNQNFAIVEGTSTTKDTIKNKFGEETSSVIYSQDSGDGIVIFPGMITNSMISASTKETGIALKDYANVEKNNNIEDINLGMVLREQPDLALMNDIHNARVQINDQSQTYLYGSRFNNLDKDSNGFDVGVKFGEKYGDMTYSRPIYYADYITDLQENSKELKVYITYQIGIENQSTNLVSKVNSIVNYYDSNYAISAIGTTLKNGKVENNTEIIADEILDQNATDAGMKKQKISINTDKIEPQTRVSNIYIEYELNREAVERIITDQENLNVLSEIYSYSTFDKDGNNYAGLDVDSKPGNVDPRYPERYKEDDSDYAPGIKLEKAESRTITGTVFLDDIEYIDGTDPELMTGEIRKGNGIYDEAGEKTINGVTVHLIDQNGTVKNTTGTNENGEYTFSNFIPGDYTVQYVWGDETYNVNDYKATIYNDKAREGDPKWHQQEDPRYSDAMDDYTLRTAIDNGQSVEEKMISTTPNMVIGVENTYETFLTGEISIKEIPNIDFGIVERARQSVGIEKKISSLKLTLANGQTLIDTNLDNGNLQGQNLQHLPDKVEIQLDSELTQGAKLEVTYTYTVTNLSELDYKNKDYYHYGKESGDPIEMTINKVVDYLDKDWAVDLNSNTDWGSTTVDEMKNHVIYDIENTESVKDKTMLLYEEAETLAPTKTFDLTLNVSKLLSASDDIELDNEVEIIEVTASRKISTSTLGNYVPGKGPDELDDDKAETLVIIPPTGANLNYIVPVIIVVVSLGIIAIGIIVIRKKVLNVK